MATDGVDTEGSRMAEATMGTQMEELQEAFVAALANSGVLGKIRAQLRAAALGVMRNDSQLVEVALRNVSSAPAPHTVGDSRYHLSALVVEEFLRTHGMWQALAVFQEEANLSQMDAGQLAGFQDAVTSATSAHPADSLLERLVGLPLHQTVAPANGTASSAVGATESVVSARATTPDKQQHLAVEEEVEQLPTVGLDDAKNDKGNLSSAAQTALAAYEDSIDFSDASLASSLGHSQAVDFIERVGQAP